MLVSDLGKSDPSLLDRVHSTLLDGSLQHSFACGLAYPRGQQGGKPADGQCAMHTCLREGGCCPLTSGTRKGNQQAPPGNVVALNCSWHLEQKHDSVLCLISELHRPPPPPACFTSYTLSAEAAVLKLLQLSCDLLPDCCSARQWQHGVGLNPSSASV